ncbi:MAG: hypothetical protein K2N94_14625 [Lachnospiraceae bacterium]|nr:hypothetical protein [Lachnospiraceae bacterium]
MLEFAEHFKGRNAPILILDEKWLEIFPEHLQNSTIRALAAELSGLLKEQGRQVDEIKGMKRYKSQMMQEIVENMDADDTAAGKIKRRKMDKSQKKILELNEKLEQRKETLSDLPYRIREVNTELLFESTRVCYERFRENLEKMNELEEEIAALQAELKMRKLDKQEREMRDEKMYTYLHSVLGPELMERLDAQEE